MINSYYEIIVAWEFNSVEDQRLEQILDESLERLRLQNFR